VAALTIDTDARPPENIALDILTRYTSVTDTRPDD
jgi:hypothetical protein